MDQDTETKIFLSNINFQIFNIQNNMTKTFLSNLFHNSF